MTLESRSNNTRSYFIRTPTFFFRKKGYIHFVPKADLQPSVCQSVRAYVCMFIKFLVNGSAHKLWDIATANFAGA